MIVAARPKISQVRRICSRWGTASESLGSGFDMGVILSSSRHVKTNRSEFSAPLSREGRGGGRDGADAREQGRRPCVAGAGVGTKEGTTATSDLAHRTPPCPLAARPDPRRDATPEGPRRGRYRRRSAGLLVGGSWSFRPWRSAWPWPSRPGWPGLATALGGCSSGPRRRPSLATGRRPWRPGRRSTESGASTARTLLAEARAALALDRAADATRALEAASAADPTLARGLANSGSTCSGSSTARSRPSAWAGSPSRPSSPGRAGRSSPSTTLAALAEPPDDEARDRLDRWIAADPDDLDARVALLARVAANVHPGDPDRASRIAELAEILGARPGPRPRPRGPGDRPGRRRRARPGARGPRRLARSVPGRPVRPAPRALGPRLRPQPRPSRRVLRQGPGRPASRLEIALRPGPGATAPSAGMPRPERRPRPSPGSASGSTRPPSAPAWPTTSRSWTTPGPCSTCRASAKVSGWPTWPSRGGARPWRAARREGRCRPFVEHASMRHRPEPNPSILGDVQASRGATH